MSKGLVAGLTLNHKRCLRPAAAVLALSLAGLSEETCICIQV